MTAWKAIIAIHRLNDRAAMKLVRLTLTGVAKNWYLINYSEFKTVAPYIKLFTAVFLPPTDVIVQTERMLAREQ